MGINGVHHIAIQTGDFEKALEFYSSLGLEITERKKFKTRDFAWLKAANIRIELYSKRGDAVLDKWSDLSSGPVHIAFEVDAFDAFLEKLRKQGRQFHPSHPEPFTPPVEGAKQIAYLLGPDGEEVEIREQ
jgi:catechol 2,3-dioxygenase-like lactoylglutathione lyase family enzyme